MAGDNRTRTTMSARELLHGCVRVEDQRDGWVRPWRLTEGQVLALSSAMAWHPGVFRQITDI